jgi:GNAT superfamily N-acetyltransferase
MDATHGTAHDAGTVPERIEFRPLRPEDREPLLAIAAQVWEGHDYLPHVFDAWVADPRGYFAGIFLGERLAGCGRYLALDERRAWLEGLRIDPALQGRGLGRRMSVHVARTALARGHSELRFSTYFRNDGSIRISEQAGFRRIAVFTHLEVEDLSVAETAVVAIDTRDVQATPGIPDTEEMLVNDWFFVPGDVPGRAQYFPDALTLSSGADALLVSRNAKYPGCLEVSWQRPADGRGAAACLAYAIRHARDKGYTYMHTMLPAGRPLTPFTDAGFVCFEQEQDTYLYAAHAADLRL